MTRDEIEDVLREFEVLCDLAARNVRSHMPIGLGEPWRSHHDAMLLSLEAMPRTFRRLVAKARREHGWGG
jgi:hypothetical protein